MVLIPEKSTARQVDEYLLSLGDIEHKDDSPNGQGPHVVQHGMFLGPENSQVGLRRGEVLTSLTQVTRQRRSYSWIQKSKMP